MDLKRWNFGVVVPAMIGELRAFIDQIDASRELEGQKRTDWFRTAINGLRYRLRGLTAYTQVGYHPLTVNPLGLQNEIDEAKVAVRKFEVAGCDDDKRELSDYCERLARWWCTPHNSYRRWDFPGRDCDKPGNVIAFPVTIRSDGQEGAGEPERGALFYVRAHRESYHGSEWQFDGFADDIRHRHLDNLARRAISIVTKIRAEDVPPREVGRLRRSFGYELLFDAEVHTGLSHTGAVLVLFVICYLYETLQDEALELIKDYKPNAVITAEVCPDGSLAPVDGLRYKLPAAVDAWGPEVEFFLAKENVDEAQQVLQKAQSGPDASPDARIHGYTAAESLVEGVLGSLEAARTEWLRRLRPAMARVILPLLPPDRAALWRQLQSGEPMNEEVARVSEQVFGKLEREEGGKGRIRLSFSELALEDEDLGERRAVIVACAADEADSPDGPLWPRGTGLSLITRLVHAMAEQLASAKALGSQKTTVFVHLLSACEPALELVSPMGGKEIENRLQEFRSKEERQARGRFLRPVLDYWADHLREYDLAELYVLSVEEVPDILDELADGRLPRFFGFYLIDPPDPNETATWVRRTRLPVVHYWAQHGPDQRVLRATFGKPPYHFESVRVCFGPTCPVWWDTSTVNWKLCWDDNGHYSLQADDLDPNTVSVDLQFETRRDVIAVDLTFCYRDDAERGLGDSLVGTDESTGTYRHQEAVGAREETVRRIDLRPTSRPRRPTSVLQRPTSTTGKLQEKELERLTSGEMCRTCEEDRRHLLCRRGSSVRGTLVFDAMQQAVNEARGPSPGATQDGFVIVDRETGWWALSTSGCQLPGSELAAVLCNDEISIVGDQGEPFEATSVGPGLLLAEAGGRKYYLARVNL